jgi:hypothetical protein
MKVNSKQWKDYSRITGAGGTFTIDDVIRMTEGMKYSSTIFDQALNIYDRIAAPARTLYNAEEQMFKFAKYLHNLEKGLTKRDAAWDAMKWTFNYGEVTRATAFMRSNLAPFFTWQSKIFPLMAESIIKNPVQWAGVVGLYQAMQVGSLRNLGLSNEEVQYIDRIMPNYIKNGMFFTLPWRDQDGRLQLMNLTYIVPGFGDFSEMKEHPAFGLIAHPLISIANAWMSNEKFSGAPLSYDWEPASTRLGKKLAYVWETLIPAPFPGGTDWEMLRNTFWERVAPNLPVGTFEGTPMEVPEALRTEPLEKRSLTPSQAFLSFFGLKITPGKIEDWGRAKESLVRIQLGEIRTQFEKEYMRAQGDRERDAVTKKYQQRYKEFGEKLMNP